MSVPRHCDFLGCLRQRHCSRRRLKFPYSRAWPCPPLTLGSAQGNLSHSDQFPILREKDAVLGAAPSTPGAQASPQTSPASPPPHPNIKVCGYGVMTSPQKVPYEVLNRCLSWKMSPWPLLRAPAQTPPRFAPYGRGGRAPRKSFEVGHDLNFASIPGTRLVKTRFSRAAGTRCC